MLIGSVIVIIVALVLIGIGLVAGIVIFSLVLFAGAIGVISISTAVGLLQKKFSSGLRTLSYQILVLSFAVAGVFMTFIASMLSGLHCDALSVIGIGVTAGTSVGLLFGLLASWIIDVAIRILKRFASHQSGLEKF